MMFPVRPLSQFTLPFATPITSLQRELARSMDWAARICRFASVDARSSLSDWTNPTASPHAHPSSAAGAFSSRALSAPPAPLLWLPEAFGRRGREGARACEHIRRAEDDPGAATHRGVYRRFGRRRPIG